jgi:hypothetical protein
LDRPNYLSGVSADTNALTAAALLAFVNGLAVVGIAVLVYPLLKGYSEPLALGYVGFQSRRTCSVPLLTGNSPLLVIALGDGSASQELGSLLQAQYDVAIVMVYLIVSVAGGILAFLLFQTKLIPRWLAVIGVIAYPVLFVGTVLDMFDLIDVTEGAGLVAVAPGGLFELILPIWLLAKGFSHPVTTERRAVASAS